MLINHFFTLPKIMWQKLTDKGRQNNKFILKFYLDVVYQNLLNLADVSPSYF